MIDRFFAFWRMRPLLSKMMRWVLLSLMKAVAWIQWFYPTFRYGVCRAGNFDSLVACRLLVRSVLVAVLFASTVTNSYGATKTAAPTETISSFVMPDGTIYDVPNNYTFAWYKETQTVRTKYFSMFLKLPELEPQNQQTWEGLHLGHKREQTAAIRIGVQWLANPRFNFGLRERYALEAVERDKHLVEIVPDPDNFLHYHFNWPARRKGMPFDELYLHYDDRGLIRQIKCGTAGIVPNPSCQIRFLHGSREVELSLPRSYFHNWKQYEKHVRDLLEQFRRKKP